MAVQLYVQALGVAPGPAKDVTGRRALINYALAHYRDAAFAREVAGSSDALRRGAATITDIDTIVFDAQGNANIASYGLVRWDGAKWQPAPRL